MTHGLPARQSQPSVGHHVPEQPTGTACSRAPLAVPPSLPRPQRHCPSGTGGRGAELPLPMCCPARGGLHWASAHRAASFLVMRGVCVQLGVRNEPGGVCIEPGESALSQGGLHPTGGVGWGGVCTEPGLCPAPSFASFLLRCLIISLIPWAGRSLAGQAAPGSKGLLGCSCLMAGLGSTPSRCTDPPPGAEGRGSRPCPAVAGEPLPQRTPRARGFAHGLMWRGAELC